MVVVMQCQGLGPNLLEEIQGLGVGETTRKETKKKEETLWTATSQRN